MKKYLLLLLLPFLFLNNVYADENWTSINIQYGGSNYSELYYLQHSNWISWTVSGSTVTHSCNGRENCYLEVIDYFNSINYSYYSIYLNIYPPDNNIEMILLPFNFSNNDLMYQYTANDNRFQFYTYDSNEVQILTANILEGWSDPNYNNFYMFYDSNYTFSTSGNFAFYGFYDNESENGIEDKLKIYNNESPPKLKDLIQYNSWADYESNHVSNYETVNLDNYEYVLLSLKNYSNVQPFQSNLYLKGQVGITPIYNFGQSSKDSITGVQVQDRCNLLYNDFTEYPFYILQSDIQNNAIYAVKSCSTSSSFKYDTTVFDITYITSSNVDNPTVTINGKTYNVIPYNDLPSTATKNEENNYIPGESGDFNSVGGLDSALKSAQQKMSEIWNVFNYFTDFISQIFSSLPPELHTILISAFVISIVLGLIKIFVL